MDITKYQVLLLLLLLCGLVFRIGAQQLIDCKKTGPCSCSTNSGVIDLSALDSTNPYVKADVRI